MTATNEAVKGEPRMAKTQKTTKRRWLPRHDIFAAAIVSGRSIKDAFVLAGGARHDGGTQTSQTWLRWPPMIERIAVLRAERMNSLALDKDQVILNLVDTYNQAMRADQYMAAVRAMDQVAKLLDLYPTDKQQLEVTLINKPASDPTKVVELSVEDWKNQFSPKEVTQQ